MPRTSYRKLSRSVVAAGVAAPMLALSACSSDTTSDIQLPGAPEGFALTAPGSKLDLGEPAYVATETGPGPEDQEPAIVFWKMTAQGPVDKPLEGSEDVVDDPSNIDHFVCMMYDIEYLGTGGEVPEFKEIGTPYDDPRTMPIGEGNRMANFVGAFAGDGPCEVAEEDKLPDVVEGLEEGKVYKGVDLGFVSKEEGIDPTGLEFTYAIESVPELDDHTATVSWNKGLPLLGNI